MRKTKTIIVLGMHRSGTSMIAGILKILGINMGEKLLGADWSNPLGHFEDIEFISLNDEILKKAEGSWDNPPFGEKILAQKEKFSDRIKALIEKKKKSEIWGWKDPRTALTIELYLPYLENFYFIVCYRDWKSIAYSLQRRNKMEIEKGIKLSKIYYQRIDRFFHTHPNLKKLQLNYEEVIKKPKDALKNIIDFLNLTPNEIQYQKALNFILFPQEKERLIKKMKRKKIIKNLKKGILHPWKALRFIRKRFLS